MLKGEEVVVVINEEAVRTFELGSAENAIHENRYYKNDTFRIVGVVKNFHWHSLVDAHTPYLFEFYNDCRMYFSFRMNLSNIPESLAHIESTYNAFFLAMHSITFFWRMNSIGNTSPMFSLGTYFSRLQSLLFLLVALDFLHWFHIRLH